MLVYIFVVQLTNL